MTAPFVNSIGIIGGATKPLTPPSDSAAGPAVIPLDIPGDVYVVRAGQGQRETIVSHYDLSLARVKGNAVAPAWSDAALVVSTYGLEPLHQSATQILNEVFGGQAGISLELETDPDSRGPMLIFHMEVPRDKRDLREQFVDRYVRETSIPLGAPVPVLAWSYR